MKFLLNPILKQLSLHWKGVTLKTILVLSLYLTTLCGHGQCCQLSVYLLSLTSPCDWLRCSQSPGVQCPLPVETSVNTVNSGPGPGVRTLSGHWDWCPLHQHNLHRNMRCKELECIRWIIPIYLHTYQACN